MAHGGLVKITLCYLNFGLMACSVILMVGGEVLFVTKIYVLGSLIMVVAMVAVSTAFTGCVLTFRSMRKVYLAYQVLFVVSIAVQVVLLIIVYVWKQKDVVAEMVKDIFTEHWNDPVKNTTVNAVQKMMKCCGFQGPRDWPKNSLPHPQTCFDKRGRLYLEGCGFAVENVAHEVVGNVAVNLLTLALVIMLLLCSVQ